MADTLARLRKAGLPERVVVDASHGNSRKDHVRQAGVVGELAARIAAGEQGITGVMIESHINEGRQDVPPAGPSALKHGVSITDACVDWASTVEMLDALDRAVQARREALLAQGVARPAAFERAAQVTEA